MDDNTNLRAEVEIQDVEDDKNQWKCVRICHWHQHH